jgi:hypothetical protein
MRSWACSIALGILSLTTGVSCLGQPIPRRVVAGTTLTFPFDTGGISDVPVGYGADPAVNQGTLLSPDRQRGNVRFVLCAGTNCATERPLILRYMGRVTPDRGSRLGRTGDLEARSSGATSVISPRGLRGQPIVILDVPATTPVRTYQLTYVLRRPGASTDERVTLQSIDVVAGNGTDMFTDLTKALNLEPLIPGQDLTPSLQGFVPDPQLQLSLIDEGLSDRPAAGTLVLRHPSTVQIQGAFEDGVLGQGSIVRINPGPTANTVSILFVDPDQRLTGLRVAFELSPSATAPASPTAFVIDSQVLYRQDGSLLPTTTTVNAVGNSFGIRGIF